MTTKEDLVIEIFNQMIINSRSNIELSGSERSIMQNNQAGDYNEQLKNISLLRTIYYKKHLELGKKLTTILNELENESTRSN